MDSPATRRIEQGAVMNRKKRDVAENLFEHWIINVKRSQSANYKAAQFYAKLNLVLGIPTAVLATIVGTSVFATLQENVDPSWRIATGIISILAAVLASLQTFLGFSDRASKHRQSGSEYGSVKREIQEQLVVNRGNEEKLNKAIPIIRRRMDVLAKETPPVPKTIWAAIRRDFPSKPNDYYQSQIDEDTRQDESCDDSDRPGYPTRSA